jgi:hypothetical protein
MFIFLIKLNYDTFVQISDLEEAETNLREELTATENRLILELNVIKKALIELKSLNTNNKN